MTWWRRHQQERGALVPVVDLEVTGTWPAEGGRPPWMVDGMPADLIAGTETLEVGVADHDQDILWAVAGLSRQAFSTPVLVLLVAEEGHECAEAISAWISGYRIGYLPRDLAAELRPELEGRIRRTGRAVALHGIVAGGGVDAEGRMGELGLWLQYDPAAFAEPVRASQDVPERIPA